jgi:hypothetical protein
MSESKIRFFTISVFDSEQWVSQRMEPNLADVVDGIVFNNIALYAHRVTLSRDISKEWEAKKLAHVYLFETILEYETYKVQLNTVTKTGENPIFWENTYVIKRVRATSVMDAINNAIERLDPGLDLVSVVEVNKIDNGK